MSLLTLKSANGLKTIYIDTLDKVLDLFDQKYHFLETIDTITQKLVKRTKTLNPKPLTLNPKRKNKSCVAFNPNKCKWA